MVVAPELTVQEASLPLGFLSQFFPPPHPQLLHTEVQSPHLWCQSGGNNHSSFLGPERDAFDC